MKMRVTVHVDGRMYRAEWTEAMVELYRGSTWVCACLWDGSLAGAAFEDLVPSGDPAAVRAALEAAVRAAREASDEHEREPGESSSG